MKIHYRKNSFLPLAAALALLVNQATAAIFTWTGATPDYSLATNWSGGSAPSTNSTTNEVTINNNTNVASMVIVTNATYYVKSLTFGASNTANTRFVLAGSAGATANTRPLVFSSDTGTATLTVSGTGNKTIDRTARVNDTGNDTMSLTSHLDVVHNGSGNLTLGNGENANSNWGIRIVGAGNINKSGTGTLILAGNNTYTGQTNINAGAVRIQRSASLGGTAGGTSVTATGASLQLDGTTFGALAVTGEALSLNGTGISGNGALRNLGGANSWSGAVTLAGAATIQSDAGSLTFTGGITNGGNTLTVQGAADTTVSTTGISGAGGLTKTGGGTLTLSAANTYDGATTLKEGLLTIGTGGTINGTSGVTIGTASTAATAEFNYNSSTALTQAVSFAAGSTGGKLSGTGTINLAVNVTTGNTLAIGNSIGAMAFGNNLEVGGTFLHELMGGGSTADLGDVAGNLTLGGILDLVQLGTYTVGNKFTLFAYDGTLTGLFKDSGGVTSILDDTNFTDAGGIWRLNYNDTTAGLNGGVSASNTYVTITAIPEPNVAALLGGLGTLALLRRRR